MPIKEKTVTSENYSGPNRRSSPSWHQQIGKGDLIKLAALFLALWMAVQKIETRMDAFEARIDEFERKDVVALKLENIQIEVRGITQKVERIEQQQQQDRRPQERRP